MTNANLSIQRGTDCLSPCILDAISCVQEAYRHLNRLDDELRPFDAETQFEDQRFECQEQIAGVRQSLLQLLSDVANVYPIIETGK